MLIVAGSSVVPIRPRHVVASAVVLIAAGMVFFTIIAAEAVMLLEYVRTTPGLKLSLST
jgi:hypothetical protein